MELPGRTRGQGHSKWLGMRWLCQGPSPSPRLPLGFGVPPLCVPRATRGGGSGLGVHSCHPSPCRQAGMCWQQLAVLLALFGISRALGMPAMVPVWAQPWVPWPWGCVPPHGSPRCCGAASPHVGPGGAPGVHPPTWLPMVPWWCVPWLPVMLGGCVPAVFFPVMPWGCVPPCCSQ